MSDAHLPGSPTRSIEEDVNTFKNHEVKATVVNVKSLEPVSAAAAAEDPTPFGIAAGKLMELFDPKAPEELRKLGGLDVISKAIHADTKRGLSGVDMDERIRVYGPNRLPEVESASFLSLVWGALHDEMLILLCVASIVSIVLGMTTHDVSTGWIEGTAILVAVIIVVLVTSGNDYQKEQQFRKLNAKKNDRKVNVIRNGSPESISIFDLVVGDILVVETGDIIPADGIFIEGHNVRCDESSATGESDAIKKGTWDNDERLDPFFLSGSQCIEGMGKMLVCSVGVRSLSGKTLMGLRVESEDTPLQTKLGDLASVIGKVGTVIAILTFVILMAKEFIRKAINKEDWNSDVANHVVKYLITAITIVVVAVPEGLPLAVTISLAYSMLKMLKDNNLVRRLEACETMGGASQICSDKTGTLTTNRMTVVKGWVAGYRFEDEPSLLKLTSVLGSQALELLGEGICINSSAYEAPMADGAIEFIGSKTECALLDFSKKLDFSYRSIRDRLSPSIHMLYPFSSKAKAMSVLLKLDNAGGGDHFRVYQKGASEIVLDRCASIVSDRGSVVPLSALQKDELKSVILAMASDGLRTICLAYSDINESRDWTEPPETGLTVIGIVGIQDPVRPEVPDAVANCQRAGITVRMVTGDNIVTAKNIARKCGIFTDGIAMEGPEFRKLQPHQIDEILPTLQVLARSSPLDKQILVGRLKEKGEVVAVTGDGTNDAPALRMAHVGFAMGIAGTEVAKEASSIILLDDNFASIVKAVLWGRNVYQSIQRFLQFQLTVNVVAVVLAFVGSISNADGESPLSPVQLLWVNLIMDTMGALALATDPPTPDLLNRKPVSKDASLITVDMWRSILGMSVYQLTVNFILLYRGAPWFNVVKDSTAHYTIIFNCFVYMQVFNEINARSTTRDVRIFRGFFTNYTFIAVVVFTAFIQALIVEFGGSFTSTTSLTANQWIACVIIGLVGLPFGFLVRKLPDFPIGRLGSHKLRDSKSSSFVSASEVDNSSQEMQQVTLK